MIGCMRWVRARWQLLRAGGERGSALVEFLGVGLILLIPTIYLVITMSRVQAAAFAADGAAREAGRLIAQAESLEEGAARAAIAVELAFADQGFDVNGSEALAITCQEDPCLTPGAYVHVEVGTDVELPLVPSFLAEALATQVRVEGEALTAIDEFRGTP